MGVDKDRKRDYSDKLISSSQARKDFIQEQAQSLHKKEKISQKANSPQEQPEKKPQKEASFIESEHYLNELPKARDLTNAVNKALIYLWKIS